MKCILMVHAMLVLWSIDACSGHQSKNDAVRVICDIPDRIDMINGPVVAIPVYVGEHVSNREILDWYRTLGSRPPAFEAAELREMARAAGVERCEFADHLERR